MGYGNREIWLMRMRGKEEGTTVSTNILVEINIQKDGHTQWKLTFFYNLQLSLLLREHHGKISWLSAGSTYKDKHDEKSSKV